MEGRAMRTTIELSDDLIAALHALAVSRGQRGYSKIMEEAVSQYLKKESDRDSTTAALMKMMGSWKPEEASETRKKLEEIRKNWKT
jgi:predicted transcriptional regulator